MSLYVRKSFYICKNFIIYHLEVISNEICKHPVHHLLINDTWKKYEMLQSYIYIMLQAKDINILS